MSARRTIYILNFSFSSLGADEYLISFLKRLIHHRVHVGQGKAPDEVTARQTRGERPVIGAHYQEDRVRW